MIKWKFYNRFFSLKSKAISCNIYSHGHVQFRLYGLFYLNLLNTNTHICDFEISVKGFRSPLVVDLYVATCFHQFFIVDLVPVNAC